MCFRELLACRKILHYLVVCFRNIVSKYEDGRVIIPSLPAGTLNVANLLLKHALPLVGEMTGENQLILFQRRPLLVAYFDVDWDKQLKKGG